MAYTYTRQSTFSDGDTITAALFNDEYNQLVNAFAYTTVAGTTGHRHDGSSQQGGTIHTIGDLDLLNKIVADSTNNRWGVFVQVSSSAVEQIRIQDGAIVPVTDNDIDLGTSSLEFKDAFFDGTVTSDAFAGPLTGDVTGTASLATSVTVSANNSTDETTYPIFVDGATGTQGAETDTGLSYNPSTGLLTLVGLDIGGDVDVDGTLESDAYTVAGVALSEYIADTVGAMVTSNTETNITVTYDDNDNTLDFVSLGTITALNNATANELVTIGSTTTELDAESGLTYDGTDLVVTGNIDLSGDIDVDGTMEADVITVAGTALNEYIADTVGAMVSSNTETDITVTYDDGDNTLDFVIGNISGTAALATSITASANNSTDETVYPTFVDGATGTQGIETDTGLTYNPSTGMLTSTGVTSTFTGNITGNVTGNTSGTAATVTGGTQASITSTANLVTVGTIGTGVWQGTAIASGYIAADAITGAKIADNAIDSEHYTDGSIDNAHIADNAIDSEHYADGSIDNAHIADDAIDSEHYAAGSIDTAHIADDQVTLDKMAGLTRGSVIIGNSSGNPAALAIGTNAYVLKSDGTDIAWAADAGLSTEEVQDIAGGMFTSNTESGITVTYQDGDGTVDFTVGTLNQDTTGTADLITASANNSTDETVYPVFVDGATGSQGAETDTGFTYNPSTGMLTTTGVTATFTGNITGNVTGNTSGTALTVTQAAQTAITSLGTLTALTVDDVAVNGKVITMTGDTSDTAVFTAGSNGTLAITTTDAAAAAANITITADGTFEAIGTTVTLDSGGAINLEPASGSAILLDGTISVDAGVVTGATSITSTAFVGDITGDVTGNADTATLATTITASANNSTNETVYLTFTDGATGTQGLETDTDLYYNPSTGIIYSTTFAGSVVGNVTGNASGTAATVTSGTQAAITTLANLTTSGALNAGSITSGFGTIDTGSSAITTTGLISGGSLDIDNVLINGTTIGHTDDTDLITLADGIATVAGEISVTTLDIGGTNVTSTAAELNILDGVTSTAAELNILDGVNSTAAELNIMDGGTAASSTTLADADRIVVNDAGTMKQVAMTDFDSDRFSIVTSAPSDGTGKRTGHVWYVV